ncbi:MAG TPA: hypothetical protein VF169_00255 [Albitalea sp.]|uniref:hypothetical protein n=1 Tax=Piscinibacter sp. TaxID=1903157 RepID=UPI002ED08025
MNPSPHESLRDALQRAAEHLRSRQPATDVPAAVWNALPPTPRAPRRLAWAGISVALATLAVAVVLLTLPPAREPALAQEAVATPFLPVAAAERWPQLLRETREQGPAWVVPAELPRESLASMGLPYDPARAGQPVRAELLVHPSGDVIAVRFVQ